MPSFSNLSLTTKLPSGLPRASAPTEDCLSLKSGGARGKHCDFHLVPFDEHAASKIMPKKVCGDSQLDLSSFSVAWGQNRPEHSGDQVFCNSLFHTLAPLTEIHRGI